MAVLYFFTSDISPIRLPVIDFNWLRVLSGKRTAQVLAPDCFPERIGMSAVNS